MLRYSLRGLVVVVALVMLSFVGLASAASELVTLRGKLNTPPAAQLQQLRQQLALESEASKGWKVSTNAEFGNPALVGTVNALRVILEGKDTKLETLTRHDGTFSLFGVPQGKFTLTIVSLDFYYGKFQVTVSADDIRVVDVTVPGKPQQTTQALMKKTGSTANAFVFEPKGKFQYFEQRQQVNIMSFFMNPMMLMMLVTLAMVWVMPKMMEGMSPEELKEAQARMAQQQNPNEMFKNLFGVTDDTSNKEKEEDSD